MRFAKDLSVKGFSKAQAYLESTASILERLLDQRLSKGRRKESRYLGLTTIFIHLQNGDDCTAASLGDSDIQAFRSPIETRQFAEKNRIPFKQSRSDLSVSGLHWIRLDYPDHAIHYQFQEGMLTLVSIMTNAVKP